MLLKQLLPSAKQAKSISKKAIAVAKKKFVSESRKLAKRSRRTGILSGSIGGKTKDYKGRVFAVFGVRDVRKSYGDGKQEWTKNIFHLVEFGTYRSEAKPFVTNAMSPKEVADIVADEIAKKISSEFGT